MPLPSTRCRPQLYIGCNVGVFSYQIGVDPIPAVESGTTQRPVLDLDIWPRRGRERPADPGRHTHQPRGAFEAELAAATTGYTRMSAFMEAPAAA